MLWEKTRVFHGVALDDTSLGFRDLWDTVTSWLSNSGWLKQLLMGLITLMALETLICISNVSFGVVRIQLRHTMTGKGTRLGTK